MIGGIIASLVPLVIWPGMNKMYVLPFSLFVSTVASVVVCLLTKPESDDVLESFYRTVRPWGYWRPVYKKLLKKYAKIRANTNLPRDAFNVAIGIAWQLMLMVVPICIVIRNTRLLWVSIAVLAVTSIIMKYTWYDTLGPGDMTLTHDE